MIEPGELEPDGVPGDERIVGSGRFIPNDPAAYDARPRLFLPGRELVIATELPDDLPASN